MNSGTNISDKNSKELSGLLKSIIADEMVLLVKTKNYRWNVSGVNFDDFHVLFQHQYSKIESAVDQIAVRLRSLGSSSIGSMKDFLLNTQLRESRKNVLETSEMLSDLLNDHEVILKNLRRGIAVSQSKYNDAVTSGFLTNLVERHEKMAWMLTTYLA
jgi:starvation-inducible DNA-binding protein